LAVTSITSLNSYSAEEVMLLLQALLLQLLIYLPRLPEEKKISTAKKDDFRS